MADTSSVVPAAPASTPTPAEAPAAPAAADATSTAAAAPDAAKTAETPAVPSRRVKDFAAIKREEARVRSDREAIKVQQEKLELDRRLNADALKKAQEYDKAVELAKTNPRGFLEMAGIKFEDLARGVLEANTPAALVKAELAKFKSDLEKSQKDAREAQEKEAQRVRQEQAAVVTKQQIEGVKNAIKDAAAKAADKYPFVNAQDDGAQAVFDVMLETHNLTNGATILTYEQALDAVEADLRKQFEEFQKKVAPKAAAAPKSEAAAAKASVATKEKGARKPSMLSLPASEPVAGSKEAAVKEKVVSTRAGAFNRRQHEDALIARFKASLNS